MIKTKRLHHVLCIAFALLVLHACKKTTYDQNPADSFTIIGKWQYVATQGLTVKPVALTTTNTYLQFFADSTYKQLSSGPVITGNFHVQTIASPFDGSRQPAVSFSNTNSYNGDSWCKLNLVTIKDDTLRLMSNGNNSHGTPTIQIFKLSN